MKKFSEFVENMDNIRMPSGLAYYTVDEVIETLEINDTTGEELMRLMPHAYERPSPGEDDWPEPDRDEEFSVKTIWNKLSLPAKQDIVAALNKNDAWRKSL